MQEKPDIELLRDYAEHGNETAFREIVSRHADVVFASALRQAGSPDLAHDIAQGVFSDLARKAGSLAGKLTGDASLLGWLYRATRFAALNQLRDDRRRQARERHAMQQFDPGSKTAPEWERVKPVLDEAMAELSEEDREVLLLRFFKDRDFRAIAAALGVSDDAAQKRVSRALERLRAGLTSRGLTTSTGALSAVLVASTISFAPAGLAATLSTAALAGATLATTATATASKAIAMTTLQKTFIAATLTIAVVAGIYEARQNSRLREQNQTLHEQQGRLVAQIEQITRERDNVTNQFAASRDENERLNRNTAELLKLRGEVGLLRRQIASTKATQERTTNQIRFSEPFLRREEWSDKGTDKPLNAILTMFWAIRQGDEAKLEQMVSRANARQRLDELTLPKPDWNRLTGVQVVKTAWVRGMVDGQPEDAASVEAIIEKTPILEGQSPNDVEVHRWTLKKKNDQWLISFGH